MSLKVTAIVVAAGRGERLPGDAPKQFRPLAGRPVLRRALDPFLAHAAIARIVLVLHPDHFDRYEAQVRADLPPEPEVVLTAGGAERADSVAAGLAAVPADAEIVAVHDGARPLCSRDLLDRVLAAAARTGACVPGLPIPETVKRVEGTTVRETVPRDGLVGVQTPQAFRAEWLRRAYQERGAAPATDDAVLVERAGYPVTVTPGERANLKITTPEDLVLAAAWLARRSLGEGGLGEP